MNSRPVKIYSKENFPRLKYVAEIILGDILGLSWEIITDKRKSRSNPLINYSAENIPGAFKINPDPILFERGISNKNIVIEKWKGLPVFFQTSPDSDLPFDIFAASFYLITRYEEYFEFQPDKYGRFRAESSLAFKNGFLEMPIVDRWAREFSKVLLKHFPTLTFRRNEYRALLTVDADEPFAFLGKSLIRSIGGLLRDITNNEGHASDRYRVISKSEKDPYEVFDYIQENIEEQKSEVMFFFPVGDHSRYDKNPSWRNEEYRSLITEIVKKHKSGLHTSFTSSGNLSIVKTEVSRLQTILGKEVISNRFHYIRLIMPKSYKDLVSAGILEDYSMGYPDEPGFRAGIARPFFFYDIEGEQQTNLRIIPFQIMDVTLFNYRNLDPMASKDLLLKMITEINNVGGLFVSIWHNTSLLDNPEWKEWREVFEYMLKSQKI
jgi:hypothetical protein